MAKFRVRDEAGNVIEISPASKKKVNAIDGRVKTLENQMSDLLYVPISIESFAVSPSTAEMGATVTQVTLIWNCNKKPVRVLLDKVDQEIGIAGTVTQTNLDIQSTKTWEIAVADERGKTAQKQARLSFLNGVYYGAAAAPEAYDSAFILGLKKELRGSKLPSFTVTAGAGQYIFYCLPVRFGTCSFKVGGFDGGFSLATGEPVAFENASGYTENYYIYKSTNANLGTTTVEVK